MRLEGTAAKQGRWQAGAGAWRRAARAVMFVYGTATRTAPAEEVGAETFVNVALYKSARSAAVGVGRPAT
jgi:ribosomal protein L31E